MEELDSHLKNLYSQEEIEKIQKTLKKFSKDLPKLDINKPNIWWYKGVSLYIVYPDAIYPNNQTYLQALTDYLPYIKSLHFDAIHILPFLDSPMIDKGFDVKDYEKIRPDLGTMNDMMKLKKKADAVGLRVFMDLVFNHVSDQHVWFKEAEKGNEYYREFFIYTKEKPKFIRKFHKDAAVWAEYDINGKKKAINIAFPEHTGEIPHWREGKDGYWYYHTYYPEQPDLNWMNPNVFTEMSKIVLFWASRGFHFRLDAIPFVGKKAYKELDTDHEGTFAILAALHCIVDTVNPECSILVETYEQIDTIIEYFGTANKKQAELSYNFHLCTILWVSLITKDVKHLWNKMKEISKIPVQADWVNFLRNHDELSLAYLDEKLKDDVSKELLPNGASFREGYGISGRTYSFLKNDEKRFFMAFFLLTSIQGGLGVTYGDEIGFRNIPSSKLNKKLLKDTRNINRGKISKTAIESAKGKRISRRIGTMLEKRSILKDYINTWPIEIKVADKEIFAAKYKVGTSELVILINLSNNTKKIKNLYDKYVNVSQINTVTIDDKNIILDEYGGVWLQK